MWREKFQFTQIIIPSANDFVICSLKSKHAVDNAAVLFPGLSGAMVAMQYLYNKTLSMAL